MLSGRVWGNVNLFSFSLFNFWVKRIKRNILMKSWNSVVTKASQVRLRHTILDAKSAKERKARKELYINKNSLYLK